MRVQRRCKEESPDGTVAGEGPEGRGLGSKSANPMGTDSKRIKENRKGPQDPRKERGARGTGLND